MASIPWLKKQSAAVPDDTLVVQKGALTSGMSIPDIASAGQAVLVTIKNSDGGVGSFTYPSR
jgi:hypothetical protein